MKTAEPDGTPSAAVYRHGTVAWWYLELPVGENCSWWRLDGYSTYDEDGDSTDQEAQQLADDAREDIELSLSNSEDSDSESEESESD